MARERSSLKKTIFDTPVISPVMRFIARIYLWIIRWRRVNNKGDVVNYVAIFAPHTSAWDFVNMIMLALAMNLKSYWLGKHTLFKRPHGFFFRYMGGLPIDRSKNANTVEQIIKYFEEIDDMVFTLAPEGTRKPVDKWKSGFYHMAVGANVPIAIVYLDYDKKIGGIMQMYHPSGDKEKDMKEIRSLYKDVKGKNPEMYIP